VVAVTLVKTVTLTVSELFVFKDTVVANAIVLSPALTQQGFTAVNGIQV
jgi:hypothetical protein